MHCLTYQDPAEFKACSLYVHDKYWEQIYHISTYLKLRKFIDYIMIISFSSDRDQINQILKNIATFLYTIFLE